MCFSYLDKNKNIVYTRALFSRKLTQRNTPATSNPSQFDQRLKRGEMTAAKSPLCMGVLFLNVDAWAKRGGWLISVRFFFFFRN